MSARTVTLRGRRAAESLMLDTARVDEVTGSTVDANGAEVDTYTQRYAGKCKVQSTSSSESTPVAGGATFTIQRSEVHFPVGSFSTAVGQVVTLETCALDPLLVGHTFRVVALLHKSAATAYRLGVEETV